MNILFELYKLSLLPGIILANLTYRSNKAGHDFADTGFDFGVSYALYYGLLLVATL